MKSGELKSSQPEISERIAFVFWSKAKPYKTFLSSCILLISFATVMASLSLLREEWRINHRFIESTCTILYMHMNKNVTINNGSTQRLFVPSFYITYRAGKETITQWTGISPINYTKAYSLQPWGDQSGDQSGDQYKVDQAYPCWYNPGDIHEVALERGYSWSAILLMVISLYVFASLLYFTLNHKNPGEIYESCQ